MFRFNGYEMIVDRVGRVAAALPLAGVVWLIVALKFVIPVGIVFSPFWFGWANFVLDTVDGDILIPAGLDDSVYQPVDKVADWLTYVAMVVAAHRFRWPIRRWVYALFVFRTVGQTLFLVSGSEVWLFVFPNFLEPLFLVFATAVFFTKSVAGAMSWFRAHRIVIVVMIVLYKLQDEYVTHIGNIDRTKMLTDLFN